MPILACVAAPCTISMQAKRVLGATVARKGRPGRHHGVEQRRRPSPQALQDRAPGELFFENIV
jgi:hypothetical protein